MITLTIKNIPDKIYKRLKESAQLNHRSMNGQVLHCLEKTLLNNKVDMSDRLEKARKLRQESSQSFLTEDFLNEAKNEGRP